MKIVLVYVFSNVQHPKRHTKSVKIGFCLFVIFIVSYAPGLYLIFGGSQISGYFAYQFNINNLANFFVYLIVDEEFRAKLKAICKRGCM